MQVPRSYHRDPHMRPCGWSRNSLLVAFPSWLLFCDAGHCLLALRSFCKTGIYTQGRHTRMYDFSEKLWWFSHCCLCRKSNDTIPGAKYIELVYCKVIAINRSMDFLNEVFNWRFFKVRWKTIKKTKHFSVSHVIWPWIRKYRFVIQPTFYENKQISIF